MADAFSLVFDTTPITVRFNPLLYSQFAHIFGVELESQPSIAGRQLLDAASLIETLTLSFSINIPHI